MTKLNMLSKLSLLETNYAAILGVVQDRFKLNENKVGGNKGMQIRYLNLMKMK